MRVTQRGAYYPPTIMRDVHNEARTTVYHGGTGTTMRILPAHQGETGTMMRILPAHHGENRRGSMLRRHASPYCITLGLPAGYPIVHLFLPGEKE